MLKELTRVLRRPKFKTSPSQIRRITLALINSAEVVDVKSQLKVVEEDSKDNMVIETAYDGHADIIVTGDRHLLELENYEEIKNSDRRRSSQVPLDGSLLNRPCLYAIGAAK